MLVVARNTLVAVRMGVQYLALAIHNIYRCSVRRIAAAFNWLLGVIAKFQNTIIIPTGYQNETGFHLVSNLPKKKSTGRRFDESCEMNLDAGLPTDSAAKLSIGFLDHES